MDNLIGTGCEHVQRYNVKKPYWSSAVELISAGEAAQEIARNDVSLNNLAKAEQKYPEYGTDKGASRTLDMNAWSSPMRDTFTVSLQSNMIYIYILYETSMKCM